MEALAPLLGILSALAVGVVSPGPSFVMVARTAVSSSRSAGLFAALGMGAGGVVFAAAALLGLQGLLLAVPALYGGLKVAGGLYLSWLGLRIWAASRTPLAMQETRGNERLPPSSAFALGFTTQISNPKTAIVYASVFAAFLPRSTSAGFDAVLVTLVFSLETLWYAVVALVLSSQRPRAIYLRCKSWVDRVAGGVMVALGLKLIASVGSA